MSLIELAETIKRRILSFGNSRFYQAHQKYDICTLSVKREYRDGDGPYFAIGVKITEEGVVLGTRINAMVYFVKGFTSHSIRSEVDLEMPVNPTLDFSVKPNYHWLTSEEVVHKAFKEAVELLYLAREFEKQDLYFSGYWTPSDLNRVWIQSSRGAVIPVSKRELRIRIEEAYTYTMLDVIKKRVVESNTLAGITASVPDAVEFEKKKAEFTKLWMKKRKVPQPSEAFECIEQN